MIPLLSIVQFDSNIYVLAATWFSSIVEFPGKTMYVYFGMDGIIIEKSSAFLFLKLEVI